VYLQRAAQHLGFDALICTEMAVVQGVLTGHLHTPNCHGGEKVVRFTQWLAAQGLPRDRITLHAYGDTAGDQPLLRLADHARYRGQPWPHRAR
jgi:phosphatidylglycerophosphatase C